jgi:dimeric dUTPase (all-alpha-NTP-PPase superfamily)
MLLSSHLFCVSYWKTEVTHGYDKIIITLEVLIHFILTIDFKYDEVKKLMFSVIKIHFSFSQGVAMPGFKFKSIEF